MQSTSLLFSRAFVLMILLDFPLGGVFPTRVLIEETPKALRGSVQIGLRDSCWIGPAS
jgi:hypothetical protein